MVSRTKKLSQRRRSIKSRTNKRRGGGFLNLFAERSAGNEEGEAKEPEAEAAPEKKEGFMGMFNSKPAAAESDDEKGAAEEGAADADAEEGGRKNIFGIGGKKRRKKRSSKKKSTKKKSKKSKRKTSKRKSCRK